MKVSMLFPLLTVLALVAKPAAAQTVFARPDSLITHVRPDASKLDPVVLTYIAMLRQLGTDSARSSMKRACLSAMA